MVVEAQPSSLRPDKTRAANFLIGFKNIPRKACVKGRVSRFGACASDNVSAVKLIVFGPIRSEYTTPAGYGGQVFITCWHKNKTDRPVFRSPFRKKQKGCPCKTQGDFCSAAS